MSNLFANAAPAFSNDPMNTSHLPPLASSISPKLFSIMLIFPFLSVNESAKPFVQNTVQENYGIRWWNDRIPLPYTKKSNVRKELFIHWYYVDREKDDLTDMETFHVNMLYRYNVMERFDSIHINIALSPVP